MNSSETATQPPHERVSTNSFSNICLWLLVTLVGAALLAFMAGSATPRVRLLLLFPLAMGAVVAAASLSLLSSFHLDKRGWMTGWILLLAIGVPAGTTWQAWRLWKHDLRDERVAFMQQINRMMDNAADPEAAQQQRRQMMLAFAEQTSFTAYLSHRLDAFSRQVGRERVWDPPVPELLFTLEMFVSAVAALFLCLNTWQSPQGPPYLGESSS